MKPDNESFTLDSKFKLVCSFFFTPLVFNSQLYLGFLVVASFCVLIIELDNWLANIFSRPPSWRQMCRFVKLSFVNLAQNLIYYLSM